MKYLSLPFSFCCPSQIEHKAPLLRDDVIEANFYSGTLANSYEMDVLDLHYHFRFSLKHRINDGVHWNALAHRWITCLLLKHIAQAWGVILPLPQAAVPVEEKNTVPGKCILMLCIRNNIRFQIRVYFHSGVSPPQIILSLKEVTKNRGDRNIAIGRTEVMGQLRLSHYPTGSVEVVSVTLL